VTAYAPSTTAPPSAPRHPTRRRRATGLLLATAVLAATCIARLAIGTENVSLPTVWSAVTDYRDIGDQWIVHDLRIPRTVLALLVGLALGLSGTLIQAVGRNPLADSEVLGINSRAALFVVSAIALLGTTGAVRTCQPHSVMWKSTFGHRLCDGPPDRCQQLRFRPCSGCTTLGIPAGTALAERASCLPASSSRSVNDPVLQHSSYPTTSAYVEGRG
jgi:hypothetical protein